MAESGIPSTHSRYSDRSKVEAVPRYKIIAITIVMNAIKDSLRSKSHCWLRHGDESIMEDLPKFV